MMHCCQSQSWTDLQSLSGSVSQRLCCLALFHSRKCLPKTAFLSWEKQRETHTVYVNVCLSWRCSRAFLYIVPGESSLITAATIWSRCFPMRICWYVRVNWLLQHSALTPTLTKTLLSLSVQQARIFSTFICTTLSGQKVIATGFWPVSVNSVGHGAITVSSVEAGGGAMFI